jgi:hypothetical protein
MTYAHQQYALGFKVDTSTLGPRNFGIVRRGRKTYVRNYGHVLKNGKGMGILEASYKSAYENFTPRFSDLFDWSCP